MFTDADLALLARPLHGFLTVAGGSSPRPVWFEATAGGTIEFFTEASAVKVKRLRKDPRASIVVAAPVGEREHWVAVDGPAVIEEDGALELAERLAGRYWDLGDPRRAADLTTMLATPQLRVIVTPERVRRFQY